jgi:predicted phosphate transport protein (TIGR00153 family)
MRLFYESPFENLKRHADKVSECIQAFSQAVECYLDRKCKDFENLTDQVAKLESEADAIKRNIRGHLPKGLLMPMDKFQFFMYLREQDNVVDSLEEALFWLSYRPEGINDIMTEDMRFLVSLVIPPVDKLPPLVEMATTYFRTKSKEKRQKIKSLIRDIRQNEHEADLVERELIQKAFEKIKDPLEAFHLVRLVETIGSIADHAQNASDMMRAMIGE